MIDVLTPGEPCQMAFDQTRAISKRFVIPAGLFLINSFLACLLLLLTSCDGAPRSDGKQNIHRRDGKVYLEEAFVVQSLPPKDVKSTAKTYAIVEPFMFQITEPYVEPKYGEGMTGGRIRDLAPPMEDVRWCVPGDAVRPSLASMVSYLDGLGLRRVSDDSADVLISFKTEGLSIIQGSATRQQRPYDIPNSPYKSLQIQVSGVITAVIQDRRGEYYFEYRQDCSNEGKGYKIGGSKMPGDNDLTFIPPMMDSRAFDPGAGLMAWTSFRKHSLWTRNLVKRQGELAIQGLISSMQGGAQDSEGEKYRFPWIENESTQAYLERLRAMFAKVKSPDDFDRAIIRKRGDIKSMADQCESLIPKFPEGERLALYVALASLRTLSGDLYPGGEAWKRARDLSPKFDKDIYQYDWQVLDVGSRVCNAIVKSLSSNAVKQMPTIKMADMDWRKQMEGHLYEKCEVIGVIKDVVPPKFNGQKNDSGTCIFATYRHYVPAVLWDPDMHRSGMNAAIIGVAIQDKDGNCLLAHGLLSAKR